MVNIHVFDNSGNDDEESDNDGTEEYKTTFPIHKAIVCHYSPFFDATFNGNFEEGTTQEIDLRDTEPAVFSVFVEWFYSQKVTVVKIG
jgi:hypothetical protein